MCILDKDLTLISVYRGNIDQQRGSTIRGLVHTKIKHEVKIEYIVPFLSKNGWFRVLDVINIDMIADIKSSLIINL